ncbi:MAG: flavodoxin domain-containing protein [Clostridiales bacterium]|jgi:menaquinone-dependent protoporphyrinogen IX oxidase|nr:flavodoxin domain-containing protein [Clostridiales bacterium]
MRTAVIFQSKYGTTKRYAEYIARQLNCDLFETKAVKNTDLSVYDAFIFGGGLYAGGIAGSSFVKQNWNIIIQKKIALFTVGLSDPAKTDYSQIISKAFLPAQRERIKFFHLRGGIDYSELGFIHKSMMAMLNKHIESIANKGEATDEDKLFLETYGKKVNFVDFTGADEIIKYISS